LQVARLKIALKRVYDDVPAYRKKFDVASVHPDDFRGLSDLARFPFTTKQDLRDWCESDDPDPVAKAAEIVGLYLARRRMPSCWRSTRSRISRRWSAPKAI
jgi:hypothetical protein